MLYGGKKTTSTLLMVGGKRFPPRAFFLVCQTADPHGPKNWELGGPSSGGWILGVSRTVNGVHHKDQPLNGKIGPLKIDR